MTTSNVSVCVIRVRPLSSKADIFIIRSLLL
nr:hypothetical protein HCAJSMRY_HCAJSMRY_CDS_0002 [Microvirus sp.]